MTAARDVGYRDELARLTPGLRQFARALVQDHAPEAADDLVQVTLVRALGADQRRRGERLVIWLMSILTGLHRSRVAALSADHQVDAGRHTQNGAGRRHGWDLSRPPTSKAAALIGELPVECREALLLVTLVRLSYPQAAEALGLSINTVVARLARARELLGQSHFGDHEAQPAAASVQRKAPYLRVVK